MRLSTMAFALVFAAVAVSGCTYFRRQDAEKTEALLAAAGFDIKLADTQKRQESILRFPARELVARPHDGDILYFYADPDFCKCIYVGNKYEYQRYQRLALQEEIADEQVEAAEMDEDMVGEMGLWGPYW